MDTRANPVVVEGKSVPQSKLARGDMLAVAFKDRQLLNMPSCTGSVGKDTCQDDNLSLIPKSNMAERANFSKIYSDLYIYDVAHGQIHTHTHT